MRILNNPPDMTDSVRMDGFAERLTQTIGHTGLNQTEFAKKIGVSPGFVSDVVRGNKKPGADFLFAVRKVFGISVDWLLTGEGTMAGTSGIDLEMLQTIRLHIAVARAAVIESNPTAKALMLLIRDGRLNEAAKEPEIAEFLETLVSPDPDSDLALELYNGHLWTQDPVAQQRNLLAGATAHFEARKPLDKLAALSRASGPAIQINIAPSQRNAGRDYFES
jgi:transcriptional regulator with XRE-family HTH domain